MKTKDKNILIWIIIILAATNLSTVGTIIYHAYFQSSIPQNSQIEQIELPNSHLGRFIRDELNLTYDQHQQFKDLRQIFHTDASRVTREMQVRRSEIMLELGMEKTDIDELHTLATEIGDLHEELKCLTFDYYLDMKDICNDEQKDKLFQIFNTMTNEGAELKLRRGRQNTFIE